MDTEKGSDPLAGSIDSRNPTLREDMDIAEDDFAHYKKYNSKSCFPFNKGKGKARIEGKKGLEIYNKENFGDSAFFSLISSDDQEASILASPCGTFNDLETKEKKSEWRETSNKYENFTEEMGDLTPQEREIIRQMDLQEQFEKQFENNYGESSSSISMEASNSKKQRNDIPQNNSPIKYLSVQDIIHTFHDNIQKASNELSTYKKFSPINEVANISKPLSPYTKIPNTREFLKVTTSEGQCLYFPKKEPIATLPKVYSGRKSLLEVSIFRLLDEIDREATESNRSSKHLIKDDSNKQSTPKKIGTKLWVDKYRPKYYIDLLGDEKGNRAVLKWVKQWDTCVFGTKPKEGNFEHIKNQDPWFRPEKKVLLLTGPPGYGKTTLAHVIANHCGYNVIEVNASDDRTTDVVKNQIRNSLENQTIAPNHKPSLLIIDEIDGVSGNGEQNFIKLLVDLVLGGEKVKERNPPVKTFGKKTVEKKTIKKPILFPIICICNDQYATVLRSLRPIAHILQIQKCPSNLLAKRLQDICRREELSADLSALSSLTETAEGDIRSCLNTLQFLKQNSSHVTTELIAKSGVGLKDSKKSYFTIWEEIFQLETAKKHKGRFSQPKDNANRYIEELASIINTNPEYEKLMQGCFENYLKMKFHDTACIKLLEANKWIHFYDQLNYRINSNQEQGLRAYLPFPLINFHRFFAGSLKPRLNFPKTDYEVFAAQTKNENIITAVLTHLPVYLRRDLNTRTFASMVVPYLLRILSPPDIRPINQLLLKAYERRILVRLVDIMMTFDLQYVKERTETAQLNYRLEPPLDHLLDFAEPTNLKNISPSLNSLRQIISHEIELEKIRRTAGTTTETPNTKWKSKNEDIVLEKSTPIEIKPPIDFFGRPITPKTPVISEIKRDEVPKIWFRFNESSSNAVRTYMRLKDFLPLGSGF
ncbi:hypothetical protein G9A89_017626 [Geosiphon pyriformis]|nr:hypothetical protein G9A89_017626 [Geosiphon pyriformis]